MAVTNNQWYVIYTLSRHEKKVEKLLNLNGIQPFLPMHTVIRQWSDRKRKVILPLFPNYMFVNVNPTDFWKVLNVNGVIRFISAEKMPIPISSTIIESIKKIVSGKVELTTQSEMKKGELVKVISGPFIGAEGHFVRHGKKKMLVIEIELIRRSVVLEIEPAHIQPIKLEAINKSQAAT